MCSHLRVQVAGGQGTIALELLAQLHPGQLDAVFVPVGGGGLVAGIASVLAAVNPKVRVVGCQPAASNVMMESVKAGRILDLPSSPTLSDGTAGEGFVICSQCHCSHDMHAPQYSPPPNRREQALFVLLVGCRLLEDKAGRHASHKGVWLRSVDMHGCCCNRWCGGGLHHLWALL